MTDKNYDTREFLRFSAVLVFILVCLFCRKGNADEINCPYCENCFNVDHVIQPYEAKEAPGAGWYCNNCTFFQSHGSKCVHCGWPRYKKKM